MLRDLISYNAKTYISFNFITLTGYTHVNKSLCNFDKIAPSTSSAPTIDLNNIIHLVNSKMLSATFIFNQYSKDISVVLRNGVRQNITPVNNHFSNQVIIRTVYTIHKGNGPLLDKFFYDTDQVSINEEFNIIRDQYIEFKKNNPNEHMVIVIDAVIDGNIIDQYRNLYIHNRDMVISTEPVDIAPHHPFDTLESSKEYAELLLENKSGYGIVIEIIDNDQTIGVRYIHTGRQIHPITPKKDLSKSNGVYVFKTFTNDLNERKTTTAYFTIVEAIEKIGLYATYQAAEAGSDIQTQRSKELEDRKHENQILKSQIEDTKLRSESLINAMRIESERVKMEHTKQEYTFKQELNAMSQRIQEQEHIRKQEEDKWERERAELQRDLDRDKNRYSREDMRRNDYYEERSHYRKDTSEMFKFVPILLTAAVGVWAYVNKGR